MIKGNVMDVFCVAFDNGENFCLVARDSSMARLTAIELNPGPKITGVHRMDGWHDDD